MRTIWHKIPTWTKLSVFAAMVVVGFVLRDDAILGSVVIVILVVAAAIAHLWRQEWFQNPSNQSQSQSNATKTVLQGPILTQPQRTKVKNIARGPIWLFIVEWLFIAAAAHYVTNDFTMPYERLMKCISSGFDCCRFALWY